MTVSIGAAPDLPETAAEPDRDQLDAAQPRGRAWTILSDGCQPIFDQLLSECGGTL